MWDHFCQFNNVSEGDNGFAAMKFTYYCAAMQIYNVMVQSMHADPTLMSTAILTEALRQDLDAFFSDKGDNPTIN